MRRSNDELIDAPRIRDPHHGGSCEWCYYNRDFYHRVGIQNWWTRVKNISPTGPRMKALASIAID